MFSYPQGVGIAAMLLFALPALPSIAFHDPFPGTNGDVIGDARSFDIQFANITINETVLTVEIGFNFGALNQSNLDSFRYDWSPWLSPGDILFTTANGIPRWGVPIADHAGSLNGGADSNLLFAGQMYEVLNSSGFMTARQALNDSKTYYRYDSPVWLRDSGGSLAASGFPGFVNVNYLGGDGTLGPRFNVFLTVATPAGLYELYEAEQLYFTFGSATCGNDIISGFLDPEYGGDSANPEPSTWILFTTGLAGFAYLKRRRRS